jgi:hypothetical protein
MALGSTRAGVARPVLREGLSILLVGLVLVIGMVASLLFARLLRGFLYEVPALDPLTFVLVPTLLLAAVLAACLIPGPQVVLSRSNVGVMGNVIEYVSRGMRCHVLGGTRALQLLLTDVKRVKQAIEAQSPELFGFSTWKDVMSFSGKAEGEYIRGLVNLVQEYGEDVMLRALARCEPIEGNATTSAQLSRKPKAASGRMPWWTTILRYQS